MTLKPLRTRLALKLAPWLGPKEQTREWKISGSLRPNPHLAPATRRAYEGHTAWRTR